MDDVISIAVRINLVGIALVGGSLFAFSTFIMAALKRMSDTEGARAMQHINRTVFTPWFMGPFFATAILSVAAIVIGLLNTDKSWWIPMVSGGALYATGVFLVTAAGNVPLNNRLESMPVEDPETAEFWQTYLRVWTRWNHVRSVATVLSIIQFSAVLGSI